jgi:hypothetical protein
MFLALAAMGCVGHIRSEVVGQGATSRDPLAADHGRFAAAARSSDLPAGSYEVALAFELPHAQVVEYAVTCPGVERRGTVGETLDAYRARRIAELRGDRDRQRAIAAGLTNAVAGDAHADVGPVRVDANAGAAVALAIPDPPLPPGDLGARRVEASVHVVTTAAGACAISAVADDPIAGEYRVTRIRDLDAEARLRIMATTTPVAHARAALEQQLVGFGAVVLVRGHCEGGERVDPEREAAWHELDVVVRTRKALRAQLVAGGAVDRPPMPDPLPEEHPAPPAPNAAWTAGRWMWRGRWVWIGGGWNTRGVVIRPAPPRDHRR